MPEQNNTLLHRWFEEVWNRKDKAAIREMLAEDAVMHGLTGPGEGPVRGFDEFEQFHDQFLQAFPDLHVEMEDVVEQDDKIAGRYTVTGKQDGPLPNAPDTKKKVLFSGFGIGRVRNGMFVEVWNHVDFPKMQYDLAEDTPDVE